MRLKTLNRIAPSFRSVPVFLPPLYKSFAFKPLNATFPFPQVFSLSPFPLKREPTVTAWRGTTLGRDITNAISLIMPLRLRGSYATERHAFSYFTSSPTLDLLAAVAARAPSSKSHSPFISTLRISFHYSLLIVNSKNAINR